MKITLVFAASAAVLTGCAQIVADECGGDAY